MRATAEEPVRITRTVGTAPAERPGTRTAVHVSAREHQRSAFALVVIIADICVGSTTHLYWHLILWMQAVESHLFNVSITCRAYIADLLVVPSVCVVCVACSLISAEVLTILDIDSVAELPHIAEPVLDP